MKRSLSTQVAVGMMMAAALGGLPAQPADTVTLRGYPRTRTKPSVPAKVERSPEQSAAKLAAAEAKRARKAARRIGGAQ